MSTSRMLGLCGLGMIGGGVLGAGLGAAAGAASGATGAAILTASGYGGYVGSELTKMLAAGSGIVGAIGGVFSGGAVALESKPQAGKSTIPSFVASQVIGGLMGYAVLGSTMSLGKVAAASAVGSAVMAIPFSVGLACCIAAIGVGAVAVLSDTTTLAAPAPATTGPEAVQLNTSVDIETPEAPRLGSMRA
jgi:hypothetical protein